MAQEANITSIEALDRFRARLVVFLTRARRSIDETKEETRRTRMWLQHERRTFWDGQIRQRQRHLDQANAELFNAKLSKFTDSTQRQMAMVRRAKEALAEAEEKLRNTKKWNQNFDGVVDPLTKGIEGLQQFLDYDMPDAIAYLAKAQRTLESYAERAPAAPVQPGPQP